MGFLAYHVRPNLLDTNTLLILVELSLALNLLIFFLSVGSLTGTELDVMAAQEREKGNEAYRATDYEEALRHYNVSIEMDSNAMAYNNRAMTCK